ncbi:MULTISPECIES: acyltransferase family protein [Streptomyces]|uniref:acyltransferase family protein n=1 Tax=Streptomyces TaxID=1883 RepID=UPI00103ED247|nr:MULTISPECIES: acyltransferase family protein [Streptomyces]MBT3074416.1 acyltransferase [Streptomyces sp. COG21]MBT3083063.1 acyltransferase [Streptomyces sp. COG20]MBT3085882.1 acyltransferase [Streptomyces sp. CYG21]MBT3096607.1 acyltransferase [Streptomyces sp. CBG30]MBT3105255.1 acyltransferase [Streptomyces sp. COG19]
MGSAVRVLAEATPATRDRYVDLLRVGSLAVVVLGHWMMAAVTPDGVGNLLAVVPALQPLTWLLQVMPVFFFVGGFSHALSYRSLLRKRPEGSAASASAASATSSDSVYAAFLRARLQRLLRPTMVFVLVWGVVALLVQLLGGGGGLTGVTLRLVTQPLWFIGIYLAMVAFTPPLLRLHERYGWGAFAGLAGAAAAVDVLRFAAGVPYVEFLNFAFVWLAVHQLGFLRADGRLGTGTGSASGTVSASGAGSTPSTGLRALRSLRVPALLAGGGLIGAVVLVAAGPYPLSMVGMPGEKVSNMAPPTLALLAHGLWLVGAVELLRAPAARLLARPRAWRTVVAANGVAMTAFLWHLTAMLGVYGALLALDVPLPEPATAAWWAQTPLRLAAAAVLTAALVAAFRTFEHPAPPSATTPAPGSGPLAALGATLCLLGVLGLSMVGLGGLLEGRTALLIAIPVSAPAAVAMTLGGWLLVERAGRGAR